MERVGDAYPPPQVAMGWVLRSLGGGRITSVQTLLGGAWHPNHAVDVVDRKGALHSVVLRR
jgi:hypothetical protein